MERHWQVLTLLYETLRSDYNVDLLEAYSRDKNYLRAIVKSFLKGSFSNYKEDSVGEVFQ